MSLALCASELSSSRSASRQIDLMDTFGRQRGQSDSTADALHQRQTYTQSPQRLPSFRTLLSENGSTSSEQVAYGASSGYPSPSAPSPRYQNIASSSRQVVGSPTQSRPAPMPSLSQGFDDLNGRYPEQSGYSHSSLHRASEYMIGSNGVSQYPDLPTPYTAQSMNSPHFESYQANSSLPSIGELQDRRDRIARSNGGGSTSSFPTDNVASFTSLTPDSEHSSYSARRTSFYDQNGRNQASYSTLGAGSGTSAGDFARYGPSVYESNRSYTSPYGEVDYSSQSMNIAQQANFGVLGDSNDPRSKRRRGNLPKHVTDILRAWFHDHLDHPYPTEEDKQMFIARTGLSISQISNWFINARRRQLPTLRNQLRSQEHGRSSHSHVMSEREHFSSHESSLSPR